MNLVDNLQHPEILARALCLTATVGDDLLPVEDAVATAGGTLEELRHALIHDRHEHTTPVDDVAVEARRVVLEALAVLEIGRWRRRRIGLKPSFW